MYQLDFDLEIKAQDLGISLAKGYWTQKLYYSVREQEVSVNSLLASLVQWNLMYQARV